MEERGLERLRTMSAADSITGLGLSVGPAAQAEDTKPAVRTPPLRAHRPELMPFRPVARVGALPTPAGSPFPWLVTSNCREEATVAESQSGRGIDVNRVPPCAVEGVKREREKASDPELERDRTCDVSSRTSDEDEIGSTRKKLRLSKEQSALLEESFREHSTLNPKQKNALAKQLNLRPRQVEVWFQNRRARCDSLKQTEVDCELLKRCCENLTEENRRLQKELQELRALKTAPPCVIGHDLYMPLPAATLTMCPSCERVATMDGNRNLTFSKPQISRFAQQSAAC